MAAGATDALCDLVRGHAAAGEVLYPHAISGRERSTRRRR
jgi:hypothetical protein